jgi:hypothetical protein
MVVFGDSHAQMWMPAILDLAAREGWAVVPLSKSACSPPAWVGYGNDADCQVWYRWALSQVAQMHPDTVVLTGQYAGDFAAKGDADRQAISSTITKLQRSAKHVVEIGDPPPFPFEPLDCLLSSGANLGKCSTTWTYAQDQEGRAIADDVSSTGAGYIDTNGWFCDGTVCPLVVAGTITHLDHTHVTATYAVKLQDIFRAAFNAALRKSS